MARSKYCLIGIPDHEGVFNVGGRMGAAMGPQAFRQAWKRMRGNSPLQVQSEAMVDVQPIGRDIAANHRVAAECVESQHRESGLSVVVGGGHDHGFSHLVGVSAALGKKCRLGCINIDAHLDLRKPAPEISSGSPFFLAIENGVLDPNRFIEFGIQTHCNDLPLWEYASKRRIKIVPMQDLRRGRAVPGFVKALKSLRATCDAIVISLDLDALAAAFAPGVSAPQSEGFTSSEVIEMMEIAGDQAKVASLGLFELNPYHDLDDRTARLAATAAFHFLDRALRRR